MYIYESYVSGRLYASSVKLSHEDLHCLECDAYNRILGYAETRDEALQILKNYPSLSFPIDSDYIQVFLNRWD